MADDPPVCIIILTDGLGMFPSQEAAGEIPSGVESFRIGDFQMAFQDGTLDMELNRRNSCPSVYGLLLRHGLLYRGVEGRCC